MRKSACVHVCVCVCVLSHVQLFATPRTVSHQAPLSLGFPRQEYWSGLPFPPPGDLPDPGIEPSSLVSPALVSAFSTNCATSEALRKFNLPQISLKDTIGIEATHFLRKWPLRAWSWSSYLNQTFTEGLQDSATPRPGLVGVTRFLLWHSLGSVITCPLQRTERKHNLTVRMESVIISRLPWFVFTTKEEALCPSGSELSGDHSTTPAVWMGTEVGSGVGKQ